MEPQRIAAAMGVLVNDARLAGRRAMNPLVDPKQDRQVAELINQQLQTDITVVYSEIEACLVARADMNPVEAMRCIRGEDDPNGPLVCKKCGEPRAYDLQVRQNEECTVCNPPQEAESPSPPQRTANGPH